MKKKEWFIFIGFLFLVSFLRIKTFFLSVIGWDESNYLLMAQSMLNGHLPYTQIWNNKPPGIYIIFALSQILFGKSVISIRIVTCMAVAISCYLLYRLGKIFGKNGTKLGVLAGILYAVYSLNDYGLAAMPEIFFTPFVILAFYLLFSKRAYPDKLIGTNSLRFFLIGLSMGIALQIKYVVLFDLIAMLLIIGIDLFLLNRDNMKQFFIRTSICYVLLIIGPILLLIFILLYFTLNGDFYTYIGANFISGIKYIALKGFSFIQFVKAFQEEIVSNFFLWLCSLLALVYMLFFSTTNRETRRNLIFLFVWFFIAFLGVCSTKRFYSHYFLQVLPILCLISSYIIVDRIYKTNNSIKRKQKFILIFILCSFLSLNIYPHLLDATKFIYFRYAKGISNWGDKYAIISKYLKERVQKDDYIYVVDDKTIIYYLVGAKIPTKYIYPSFLIQGGYPKIIGINQIDELHSIIQKKPVYIVKQRQKDNLFYTTLNGYLEKFYIFETSINGVRLYRLKNQNSF